MHSSPTSLMMKHEKDVISIESIRAAAERIKPFVKHTPIFTSETLNKLSGKSLFFKCEQFQKTGSFKYRGATNAILRLKELDPDRQFVLTTHSSGNHALALSHAASFHSFKSVVVMPKTAPTVKRNSAIEYGSSIVDSGASIEERLTGMEAVLRDLGDNAEFIPSSDHPFIMEGAGTVGLELMQDVPDLDAVIVCCSMGGILSGVAKACKSLRPHMRVYGAEPERANDMQRSVRARKRILLDGLPDTIADGLRMSVGVNTWPVIRENVDDVLIVSEDEIVRAMFLLWERMKLLVEPSGAVPTAAALSAHCKALPDSVKRVGVIITGGNVDLKNVPWMVDPTKYNISFPLD